jgi:hypothetical protein
MGASERGVDRGHGRARFARTPPQRAEGDVASTRRSSASVFLTLEAVGALSIRSRRARLGFGGWERLGRKLARQARRSAVVLLVIIAVFEALLSSSQAGGYA